MVVLSCTQSLDNVIDQENTVPVTLTANTDVASSTKTQLGGSEMLEVYWVENDQVKVYVGDLNATLDAVIDVENPTSATFTGTAPAGILTSAIYPASISTSSENEILIPSTQSYVENNFSNNSMPMYAVIAKDAQDVMNFKNLCGVVVLNLTGTELVKKITLYSEDKLSGNANIDYNGGDPILMFSQTASNEVSLDCGEGVQLTEGTAKKFYFVVPPTESESFRVKVETTNPTDGIMTRIASKVEEGGSSLNQFARNVVINMPELKFVKDASTRLLSVNMTLEEKLILTFSSDISSSSISNECGLSVKRNDVDVTITDVTLGPNPFEVIVAVDGGIWNGDDVKVSYSASGLLKTTNGNSLSEVVDNVVGEKNIPYTPYNHNLIPNGDFEYDSPLPLPFTQWNTYVGEEEFISYPTPFELQPASGNRMMKIWLTDKVLDPGARVCTSPNLKLKVGSTYKGIAHFYGAGPIYLEKDLSKGSYYSHINICPVNTQGKWWDTPLATLWFGGEYDVNKWRVEDNKQLTVLKGVNAGSNYFVPDAYDLTGLTEIPVYISFPVPKNFESQLYFDNVQLYEYKKHE